MQTWEDEQFPQQGGLDRAQREVAAAQRWQWQYHHFISQELPFLFDLDQYQASFKNTKNPDRIQPVDAALFDEWRYNQALVVETAPLKIAVELVNQPQDAQKSAMMRRALEHQLFHNPITNFAEVRERYIGGALAGRLWCARWDFVPDIGAAGEIVPRLVDPRAVFLPKGYLTPHDPLCPSLYEVFRIPVNEARRQNNWKNTKDLRPDQGSQLMEWLQNGGGYTDAAGRTYFVDRNTVSGDDSVGDEGFATFVMVWRKFEGQKVKIESQVSLSFPEQYMKCATPACGYRTPRQFQMQELMGPDFQFRPNDPCPQCQAPMARVTSEKKSKERLAYEQGKRLEIYCLNGSVREPLYDGQWPDPCCPTYPYLWLTAYRFPHRAIPESNVSVGWTTTIARNFTMRVAFEQAHRSRPIHLFPRSGLEDRNGARFDLGDDQDDVAFYTSDFPPNGVDVVQAQPVNNALFELYELLEGAYRRNDGTSRVSIGPGETKDIAASTLKQMVDSGNMVVNGFIRGLYNAESPWITCLASMMRKFWTPARWIRYQQEMGGDPGSQLVLGSDLPECVISVSAGPDMDNVAAEDIANLTQLAGLPGPLRRVFGKWKGVDPAILNDLDAAEKAMMPPPGAAPGGPAPGAAREMPPKPDMQALPPPEMPAQPPRVGGR